MKRLVLALFCLGSPAALAEPYGAQWHPLDNTGFHSVEARNDISVVVRAGDDIAAVVDHTSADLDQFVVQQFGEWLRLDRNTRWLLWTNGRRDSFVVTLDMPVVRELKALSGASITAQLGQQDQFRAEAEDGEITVAVQTPLLRLRGNANAVMTVTGTCGRLTMLARPTSTVDLRGLQCESIVIFGDQSRVALADGAQVVDEHPDQDS